ncbi:MAG: DNA polymerase III subunit chi [Neomegalonema sp.]|nr:DNA polymerase III subunit chi [Neomegalonema sp.]
MPAEPAQSEVFFYHLTRRRLEQVLPGLLSRTLEQGWRAIVRAGSAERLDHLDRLLWSFAEESFLPHATASLGFADRQPIYLTVGDDAPNQPDLLFLTDGVTAEPASLRAFRRTCVLFDDRDHEAKHRARAFWKAVVAADLAATYFAERESGGWEKKAESKG